MKLENNKKYRLIMLLAAVSLLGNPALASPQTIYTNASGSGCRTLKSEESLHVWRCNGPFGYAAVFSDEGNVVQVEYGQTGRESDIGGLQWLSSEEEVGGKIEWRMKGQQPFAAIFGVNTRNEKGETVRSLLIAQVTPFGGCRLGLVDRRMRDANSVARRMADAVASRYSCSKSGRSS